MPFYKIKFEELVVRQVVIQADTEEEAEELFDAGEYGEVEELDAYDAVCLDITELKSEEEVPYCSLIGVSFELPKDKTIEQLDLPEGFRVSSTETIGDTTNVIVKGRFHRDDADAKSHELSLWLDALVLS